MLSDIQILNLFLFLLILHAGLAGIDVLVNHEVIEKLPRKSYASKEQWLHSIREFVFAAIFLACGWFQWFGRMCWVLIFLFGIEFLISLVDTIVEVDTRRLPVTERINHVLLYVNFGGICLLLGLIMHDWIYKPSGIKFIYYGISSWLLTIAAFGALFFTFRDGIAAVSLRKQARSE